MYSLFLIVSFNNAASNLTGTTPVLLAGSESPKANCQLKLGWDLIKPYQHFDDAGQVVGLQMELTRAIMKELGCELILYKNDWNVLLDKLNKGEIDFMADMTITDDRKLNGYFSKTYRKETYSLYIRKADHGKYRNESIKELVENGFRLGLTDGFLYSKEIESMKSQPEYKTLLTLSDRNYQNYQLLLQNRIDGFLEDSLVAGYSLREMGINQLIEGIPREIHGGEISYMFSKRSVSPSLVEAFNQALAKVKQANIYDKSWLRQ